MNLFVGLALFAGVLKESFRIADAEQKHHQVYVRAAMASDGRFAIAWIDSLKLTEGSELNLYIRFFDKGGNPVSDPYKLPKLFDTIWVYYPSLDMSLSGNTVLVWVEDQTLSNTELSKIKFQHFFYDGKPDGLTKTLYSEVDIGYPTPIDLSNRNKFAMAFSTILNDSSSIWAQRFNLSGIPQDSHFMVHDTLYENTKHPCIALNDTGDIVATWFDYNDPIHNFPKYQVFDNNDKPILPWKPQGYRLDDGDSLAGACRPEPSWIDDDRFVVFWPDVYNEVPYPLMGRVFSEKGATGHPLTAVLRDSLWSNVQDPRGRFSTDVLLDGRFAVTYTRTHTRPNDPSTFFWDHQAGLLGRVENNVPVPTSGIFEYTPPYGPDTVSSFIPPVQRLQTPAVAASDDRIVWVYSRLNKDTVYEAYAIITDWDMGEGVGEPTTLPPSHVTHLEIANPIGSSITLRYSNCPNGFSASVYDASGRRVDELRSSQTHGTIQWGGGRGCYGPGVYFIVPQGEKASPSKVVLVK
ncbi:hypothetical protein GX441_04865 [bacterium]|nr:hypothetical protein [bacterium]